jgi:hypothetical protein
MAWTLISAQSMSPQKACNPNRRTTGSCPKCGHEHATVLVRMRQHVEGYDWLCCEQCSWLFSAERIELENEAPPTVSPEQKTF